MNPDDPTTKWRTGGATVTAAAGQVLLFLEDIPQARLVATAGSQVVTILTPTQARSIAELLNDAADTAADL